METNQAKIFCADSLVDVVDGQTDNVALCQSELTRLAQCPI